MKIEGFRQEHQREINKLVPKGSKYSRSEIAVIAAQLAFGKVATVPEQFGASTPYKREVLDFELNRRQRWLEKSPHLDSGARKLKEDLGLKSSS